MQRGYPLFVASEIGAVLVLTALMGPGLWLSVGEFCPERRKGGGDETNTSRLFGRDVAIRTWLLGGHEE